MGGWPRRFINCHRARLPWAFDLDRFKTINDTLGHAAGDCLLQAVARRLQTLVRADDLVSRIGGDEFVILASEMCCADEAAMLFSRVLAAFHDPFELEGKLFHISPSIGVCFSRPMAIRQIS